MIPHFNEVNLPNLHITRVVNLPSYLNFVNPPNRVNLLREELGQFTVS